MKQLTNHEVNEDAACQYALFEEYNGNKPGKG
jgi:hypothetical protein